MVSAMAESLERPGETITDPAEMIRKLFENVFKAGKIGWQDLQYNFQARREAGWSL